jgi:hypothetical protein
MNRKFIFVAAIGLLAFIFVSSLLINDFINQTQSKTFYIGVEYAYADDTTQLKALVDKVQNYTNLFVVGSLAISFNRSALDESCDYVYKAGLNFIVFFTGIDRYKWSDGKITDWMLSAQQRYGDRFLGIYKIDEPGGNQLDFTQSAIINDTISYTQTAQSYVGNLSTMVNYYGSYTPRMLTADYALYWFDYKANYTTILAEFVGNESESRIVALNRGAATAFNRDWGVIINWKYNQDPYLESPEDLYSDLVLAYSAGAKYCVIFNYPNATGASQGIMSEEHFLVLEKFWRALQANPESLGENHAEIAYIVPQDYGFGFRKPDDHIWGIFQNDTLSAKIFDDVQTLTERYGARVDILYDESAIVAPMVGNYRQVFYWNQTIT